MNKKKFRNVLLFTAILGTAFWFTIHDSRLAEVGYSSSFGDFIYAVFIPLTAALTYELLAVKIKKGSHKAILAGIITIVVCLLWYELAETGIHETIGLLIG